MINEKLLLKLTNPSSFERGLKYYKQGRVTDFKISEDKLSAVVIGTDYYNTAIDLSNLYADCNCPAYEGNLLCKHLIAVLLTHFNGEIKTKSLPKVKRGTKESHALNPDQSNLSVLLSTITREEIIRHLEGFEKSGGEIKSYFERALPTDKSIDFIKLNRIIHNKINFFSRHAYINNYFDKMMDVQNFILSEIQSLPVNKTSSEFLLDIAYWINEKLDTIDDSHGIFSTLVGSLIAKSTTFLNGSSAFGLDIFYPYMEKHSKFDFHIDVLESILMNIDNKEVLDSLETRLDKTINRADPSFAFSRELGLTVYSHYLLKNKPGKFEEYLGDFLNIAPSIKRYYIEFLFNNNRYADVVEFAKPLLPNYYLNHLYEKSLIALDRTEQLIEYYSSNVYNPFSLENFKKLYYLCKQSHPDLLENLKLHALNAQNISVTGRIELLLFLNMPNDAAVFVAVLSRTEFELNRKSLETIVAKLCIVNPKAAILLIREIIMQELKVISKSNFYERLLENIDYLIMLNDSDFLYKLFNTIKVRYKTKRKLLERLKIKPLTETESLNQQDLLDIGGWHSQ